MEYYRSLCNLGLVYLNESVSDTENGLYGESDFHILIILQDHGVEAPFSRSASLY